MQKYTNFNYVYQNTKAQNVNFFTYEKRLTKLESSNTANFIHSKHHEHLIINSCNRTCRMCRETEHYILCDKITQEAQLLLGMADRTGRRKTVIPSGIGLATILGVGQLS